MIALRRSIRNFTGNLEIINAYMYKCGIGVVGLCRLMLHCT